MNDVKETNILEVRDLHVHFPVMQGIIFKRKVNEVRAVDGVSFTVRNGETLGLVGESGCGKTTTGRAVLKLIDATAGSVCFDGRDITGLGKKEMRPLRRKMQMIFQDPYASLNPRQPVVDIIGDPIMEHKLASRPERQDRVRQLMEMVGLDPRFMNRFPHEFSGGQRQRIGIARSLALEPRFIVCDEPIAALDVSIQAQVINLLQDLQEELGLSYLFIAHDLSVVRHISDRVIVMYLGKIVEIAEKEELFSRPLHPYSQVLLSAVPVPDPVKERAHKRILLKGEIPSPLNKPKGCPFSTRCSYVKDICKREDPPLQSVSADHEAACHLLQGDSK
ncbi:dipeptide ABC transporter ATP-binding protein [Treponema sp. OttesenSCG-928-L16]|nr:dipeptide ABC transporter ATP-binding protein [Treponema sp. OttesenSCG-928-L16]